MCYCSQWMFEKPTLNLSAICNSCVKITCYLSFLIFTFIHAGRSIQMWVSISSCETTCLLYALHPTPQRMQQCNNAIVHDRLKQLYIGNRPEIDTWPYDFFLKDRNPHLTKYCLTFPPKLPCIYKRPPKIRIPRADCSLSYTGVRLIDV